METDKSAASLRALIAVRGVHVYRVAGVMRLHPTRLSAYLHGRLPVSPELASRVVRAVEELSREITSETQRA
jgi:plasmid maintenance system antidote protein VapI